jgi:hypothetical protein
MPCYTEPPSRTELETKRLNDFLDEAGEPTARTQQSFLCRSRPRTLDQMTAWLCEWCQSHDVTTKSLELQIWWRDHQAWDAQRKADEATETARQATARAALDKLTLEERRALGLKMGWKGDEA